MILSVFVQQEGTVCDFSGKESWVILTPIEQSIKQKRLQRSIHHQYS